MKRKGLFLEVDLSQAEDRVVKVLTGDVRAIDLARRHPAEFDTHTANARAIFSRVQGRELSLEEVDAKKRYLGKRAVHAGNYGMQALKLQEILLKDGYALSLKECEELLEAVWDAQPWIPAWQAETRMKIIREKELCNSWGRRIDFKYDRMDDETFRRGYAFVPQSEVGDLLNQYGFISMAKYLRIHNMRSRIGLQVHDALILSVVKEEAYEIAKELDSSLSRERLYTGPNGQATRLSIPTEISLSPSWSKQGRVSWKRLPTRAEFDAKYAEIVSEANR